MFGVGTLKHTCGFSRIASTSFSVFFLNISATYHANARAELKQLK